MYMFEVIFCEVFNRSDHCRTCIYYLVYRKTLSIIFFSPGPDHSLHWTSGPSHRAREIHIFTFYWLNCYGEFISSCNRWKALNVKNVSELYRMQAFILNYVWKNDENFRVQFLSFLYAYILYIRNVHLDSQDQKC